MRWYQGGIAEAVSLSKKTGAVFVVYVEGQDNKSKELAELIDNERVTQQLEKEHFVAIKIEENSVPHRQFTQIYKNVIIPSIFFIGKSGSPLEITTEPTSVQEFLSKLVKILQSNGVNIAVDQSDNFIKTEQTQENSNVVCEDGVCKIKSDEEPSTSENLKSESKSDPSPEELIEKARAHLNQIRDAGVVEEEERARLKEIERRKVGQDVQKLKRWQQDNELKELMDERNKEKRENQLARQRVLDQIAQDKAERAAKFAQNSPTLPQQQQANPQLVHRHVNSNISRLQFKLPDGTTHTHEFSSSDTLQIVRNYVMENLGLPFQSFTLSTTFPRREFTNDDAEESLLNLKLVPNAVILVLPLHYGTVSTNNDSWLMSFFWSFVGPILNLVGYLKNMLFGTSPPPQSPREPTPIPNPARKRTNENNGEPSGTVPKKKFGDATVIRRQGNIHRLTDKADSDDDNNTWNGNSTQQM